MNLADLRFRCRVVMMNHLSGRGFPDMSRREILAELKPIWMKLEKLGIIEEAKISGKFMQFQDLAIRIAQEQAIIEKFRKVGNILKPRKR